MKNFTLSFLFLSLFLGFYASCGSSKENTQTENPRLPNIVIIFTDDQGYQDLGCFGSPDILTPNIDRMAKEGARFTNFYTAQPVCSASRSALLTGNYPSRIGIQGALFPRAKIGLNPNEITIAEMLKPQGYATACFGKWHLGDHPDFLPTKQGFDEYFGLPYSNDMWPLHPENATHKFIPLPLLDGDSVVQYIEDQSQLTTWYTEHAVDFINRKKDQPFFLYVPHSMPHVPLYVSDKFKGKSERGLYGDVIMEIDWSVGQILQALKDNNLDENTLVIFTSDNGPWLNYGRHSGTALPLREGKGTTLEGGVREPTVMRWPGKIPAGQEISKPGMTIDILPTLAGLTGAELPQHPIDGKDIWPIISGDEHAQNPHEAYFFYYNQNELHAVLSGDGRWKLYLPHKYRSLNGREGSDDGLPIPYEMNEMGLELYDLDNDISETKNVAADHPEIVTQMQQHAEAARAELGDKLTSRTGTGVRPVGEQVW
ncbi:MAG: sulfatase [Bacteroidia bacterium]|nr:sulfatase [Bacteroidia bacterium]